MRNKIIKCFNVMASDEIQETSKFLKIEILIKNIKKFDMHDIHIISNINNNFEYINKSLFFNDVKLKDINGIKDIKIDEIYINETIKLSYKLKYKQISEKNKLEFLLFYKINEEIYSEKKILTMKKRKKNLEIEIFKNVDKKTAMIGDVINFNINMNNKSDKTLKNIEIIDQNKKCIKIIKNSLHYNGVLIDSNELEKGIYRDLLDINEEISIKFSAIIDKCSDEEIFNLVKFSYEYNDEFNKLICVNDEFKSDSIKIYKKFESEKILSLDNSNETNDIIYIGNFKINNEMKSNVFFNIECILGIKELVNIEDFYLIQESQFNNKLCIIGNIQRELEYLSENKNNKITIENNFIEYIDIFLEYKTGNIINLIGKSEILISELKEDNLHIESEIFIQTY